MLVDTSSTSGHRATLALESNGNELTLGTTGSYSYLTSVGNLEISGGNVGIGATSPSYPFHVSTTNENAAFIESSSNNGTYLWVTNSDATTGRTANIGFAPANNVSGARIFAEAMEDFSTSANRTADLGFSTRLNGTMSEKMRIDSSGNVNIGGKDYHSHQTTVDSLQIGYALNLYEDSYTSGTLNYAVWANNSYYSAGAGNKYMRNDEASRIMQFDGNLVFQNAPAGTADNAVTFTDRLKIDNTGAVMINATSASSHKFKVESTTMAARFQGGNGGYTAMSWTGDNGTTIGSMTTHAGLIYFGSQNSGVTGSNGEIRITPAAANILRLQDSVVSLPQTGTRLVVGANVSATTFYSNPPSEGALGLFCKGSYSSCDTHLEVATQVTAGWSNVYLNRFDWVSGEDGRFIAMGINGFATDSANITFDGTNVSIVQGSDYRLKENIVDAQDAGNLIDGIQVREFDWKNSGEHQRYGMVAQELLKVAPEVVHNPKDEEEMMGVDYSKLVPMLVKEIQSLRERVAELEGE